MKNLISIIILLAFVASACAQATPTATPTPISIPIPVQVPVLITPTPALPPQILRWSVEGITDLATLDPPRITDAQGVFVAGLLFGGLVKLQSCDTPTITVSASRR